VVAGMLNEYHLGRYFFDKKQKQEWEEKRITA
jgi:hypothetical protein